MRVCLCVCVCVYIYIYRERERERERELEFLLWPPNQKPKKTLTWTQKKIN